MNRKLRPAFSKVLQRLTIKMVEEWRECDTQGKSPSERATQVLISAINELNEFPAVQEFNSSLMGNVRYAIFNYIPCKSFESRTTVSFFNFTPAISFENSINNDLLEMIQLKPINNDRRERHKVVISGNIEGLDKALFINSWNEKWSEYLMPISNESNFNYPSWNEFLLHNTQYPLHMGVVWGDCIFNDPSPVSGDYIFDSSFLNLSNKKVYSLNKNYFVLEHNVKSEEILNDLKKIRDQCNTSNTKFEKWDSNEALSYSLSSLYWGFGIWGASSFLSIPITFSSSSEEQVGVLSIGTTKPFDTEETNRWTLIANCIIGTLLNLDSEERIMHKSTNYTYRIGHPFKNRTNALSNQTRDISTNFNYLIRELSKENLVDHKKIPKLIEEIKDSLKFLEVNSENLTRFGSIVNFLSILSVENKLWTKDRKARWLSNEPIYLKQFFIDLSKISFKINNSDLKLEIDFSKNLDNKFIACKTCDKDNSLYLGKTLLTLVFHELLVNAISYGKYCNNVVKLKISLSDNCDGKLLLTNIIADDQEQFPYSISKYDNNGGGRGNSCWNFIVESY